MSSMSSRYKAARPSRAGESFARTQHRRREEEEEEAVPTDVKFDRRNPSTLAPDTEDGDNDDEDDAVLQADVIGTSNQGATKRGAINIEGYDSDSDDDNVTDARWKRSKAENMKTPNWNGAVANNDDDDDDMFAEDKPDDKAQTDPVDKKLKSVRFLDPSAIDGVESTSKSGGHVHLGFDGAEDDSEDEAEYEVNPILKEQGLEDEVGRGGLKHHAPKLEAFNLKEEHEEGRFDESGNYVRKAVDPNSVHDSWLDGVSKKEIKRAAEAHEKREEQQKKKRLEEAELLTSDLLSRLIVELQSGETPLEALARLAKEQKKSKPTDKKKKIPKWKQKRLQKKTEVDEAIDVENVVSATQDSEDSQQIRIRQIIEDITDAADGLFSRGQVDIYDIVRERLIRDYRIETGEEWVDSTKKPSDEVARHASPSTTPEVATTRLWEYRWTDNRDGGQKQGPYDNATMEAWREAGYFNEGVEFKEVGKDEWSSTLA